MQLPSFKMNRRINEGETKRISNNYQIIIIKEALRTAPSSSRADESSGSDPIVQWNKEMLISRWGFAMADLPGIANK